MRTASKRRSSGPTRSPARRSRGRSRRRSGDGAAQPGRGQLRHVRGLRGPRAGVQGGRRGARRRAVGGTDEPGAADPPLRARTGRRAGHDASRWADLRRTSDRSPAKSPTQVLQRERHQPDYLILVTVVALSAIGILMVYSSSAMQADTSISDDTFATVGPQIQWAFLGMVAMVAMMRVDYRYLRLASVPFFGVALVLLVLVFVAEPQRRRRWLRALAEDARCRPSTRRRSRSSRSSSISPIGSPSAGTRVQGFWGGTVPFLIILAPVVAPGVQGAGPRHDDGHRPDGADDVLRGRRQPASTWLRGRRARSWPASLVGLQGYQLDRIRTGSTRGPTPSGRASTPSRAARPGFRRHHRARPRAEQ